MNQLNFYLNNQKVNPPKNWRELGIECNFQDGEFKSSQVTINDWDFVRENIDLLQQWIFSGFIMEGMPFKIEAVRESDGLVIPILDGYIDLTDDAVFDEYSIQAKSKEKYSIDWINDTAAGFGFDYLASPEVGLITEADYISIPYVISAIPNYKETAIALVSLTFVGQSLYAAGKDLLATLVALTTDPLSYGQIFALVVQIVKFVAMLVAMLLLIKQMFNLLIQPVKYHKAMKLRTLFEKGCQYLNLTFDSTVVPSDWVILPKKFRVPPTTNNAFDFGMLGALSTSEFPQYGYPKDMTFSDFIIKMKDLFNGKVLMNASSGNMRFERKDYSIVPPQYTIPPIMNTTYRLNTSEIYSNLFIQFQTDVMESNTITQYKGTSYQVLQSQITSANPQFKLLKGLKQVELAYALGKRKTELTTVEKVFDFMLDAIDILLVPTVQAINFSISVVNDIIDSINDFIEFLEDLGDLPGIDLSFDFPEIPTINPIEYTPIGSLIDNRIGMLMLENDFFTQDKLLAVDDNGKLKEEQPSAKYVYENFYIIEIINNQWKLQDYDRIPFTLTDYLMVKDNPNATDDMKLESFIFNPWDETASAKTRKLYIYNENLQRTYVEQSGE